MTTISSPSMSLCDLDKKADQNALFIFFHVRDGSQIPAPKADLFVVIFGMSKDKKDLILKPIKRDTNSNIICWMFCLPKGDIITEVILFSVSSGNGQDEIASGITILVSIKLSKFASSAIQ
ncbi:uncharacterized protein LOC120652204 [Panicum virgatum]|uniref:uncharacterized protein LOC120652204 n=1 Tax=Panicum virgatum TaxID=38727 RepID=UPI0019D60210|nr:uncharacterized protein LOC120652204 [Panicum virgatum]